MPSQKIVKVVDVPRGSVQTDDDGKEWIVLGTFFQNGQQKFQRVRKGSLAHQISFPEHFQEQ